MLDLLKTLFRVLFPNVSDQEGEARPVMMVSESPRHGIF